MAARIDTTTTNGPAGAGFTTGPHPTGYTISGLGVDIDAQSGTLDPVADIYAAEAFSSREGARDPQSPLASYQATAGIGGSPDRFAPRTAVSEELHVEPGRTYVAYFQNAANGYYETPNASPGEDPGAEAGWTLGGPYGSRFVRPLGFGGDSWNFGEGDARRIPLNVYGWPNPLPPAPNPAPPPPGPVLVSTLGQPFDPNRPTCRQENQPGTGVCGFIHQRQRCGSYPSWCTN